MSSNWMLALAATALTGLLAGCASLTERATLLGDWPAALSARPSSAAPWYGVGVPRDSAAAARWFRVEADRGVPEAEFNLGVMYSRGQGVERDAAQALRWLQRADSHGIHQAEVQLGSMVASGDAPDIDPEDAERWLQAASAAGNPAASRLLGNVYASVDTASTPLPKALAAPAIAALPRAPDQTPEQQLALADRYRTGDGVKADPRYAARLYRRAADAGMADAQLRLGNAYREGVGVPRDYVLAYQWLSLAAAAGNSQARSALDMVESKLSSEGVLEAQALARKWYQQHAADSD